MRPTIAKRKRARLVAHIEQWVVLSIFVIAVLVSMHMEYTDLILRVR